MKPGVMAVALLTMLACASKDDRPQEKTAPQASRQSEPESEEEPVPKDPNMMVELARNVPEYDDLCRSIELDDNIADSLTLVSAKAWPNGRGYFCSCVFRAKKTLHSGSLGRVHSYDKDGVELGPDEDGLELTGLDVLRKMAKGEEFTVFFDLKPKAKRLVAKRASR